MILYIIYMISCTLYKYIFIAHLKYNVLKIVVMFQFTFYVLHFMSSFILIFFISFMLCFVFTSRICLFVYFIIVANFKIHFLVRT